MARLKTAVLISGRGSNMQALIDDCAKPDAPAEIVLVLSNVPDAAGLKRAESAGIPTRVVDHKAFKTRGAFEDAVQAALDRVGAQLICLAGFMRLLTAPFVERWTGRMLNIHPSLLPAYRGLDTHGRAIADGVRFTGCTVHFVVPEMDAGPIIVQAAVPVRDGDDAESLAARVLEAEHRCYPLALRLVAADRARIEGGRVRIDGAPAPCAILLNPDDGRR